MNVIASLTAPPAIVTDTKPENVTVMPSGNSTLKSTGLPATSNACNFLNAPSSLAPSYKNVKSNVPKSLIPLMYLRLASAKVVTSTCSAAAPKSGNSCKSAPNSTHCSPDVLYDQLVFFVKIPVALATVFIPPYFHGLSPYI